MSSISTYPRHPVGYDARRRHRSRSRAVAMWTLKVSLTAALGVAGYLFITAVAVPGLIAGITGQ